MIAPVHPPESRLPLRRSSTYRPDTNTSEAAAAPSTVEKVVGKHPLIALTVASLVGITVGFLVKRRDH